MINGQLAKQVTTDYRGMGLGMGIGHIVADELVLLARLRKNLNIGLEPAVTHVDGVLSCKAGRQVPSQ